MRGKFITFEGIDGAGKTTHSRILTRYLRDWNIEVFQTHEPYPIDARMLISQALGVYYKERDLVPITSTLIYYILRYEHVSRYIEPYLSKGIWVVCDRFLDSTLAYQGYGHKVDKKLISDLSKYVDLKIDLTFIIDIPSSYGLNRKNKLYEKNPYSHLDDDFLNRVRIGFEIIGEENPERCLLIDGKQSLERTSEDIIDEVNMRFKVHENISTI